MALSMSSIQLGAVVEHYWQVNDKNGRAIIRNPVRRGVIQNIVEPDDGPLEIWVQFKKDGSTEKIPGAELNIVTGPTKESLRIVRPTADNPDELMERKNPNSTFKPRVENELKLGLPARKGAVAT